MKVKELIAKLKRYDDDQIVSISAPEDAQGWNISDDFCVNGVSFGENKEERVLIYLGFKCRK